MVQDTAHEQGEGEDEGDHAGRNSLAVLLGDDQECGEARHEQRDRHHRHENLVRCEDRVRTGNSVEDVHGAEVTPHEADQERV